MASSGPPATRRRRKKEQAKIKAKYDSLFHDDSLQAIDTNDNKDQRQFRLSGSIFSHAHNIYDDHNSRDRSATYTSNRNSEVGNVHVKKPSTRVTTTRSLSNMGSLFNKHCIWKMETSDQEEHDDRPFSAEAAKKNRLRYSHVSVRKLLSKTARTRVTSVVPPKHGRAGTTVPSSNDMAADNFHSPSTLSLNVIKLKRIKFPVTGNSDSNGRRTAINVKSRQQYNNTDFSRNKKDRAPTATVIKLPSVKSVVAAPDVPVPDLPLSIST
ncbi:unnamed protein product [Didymodactylos carnosus]|uniref:Uncharacterized protein n=1 Tax=Didymodactylos carnosus TaxID=1234261 RepID=A0A816AAY8_9BILA|nr:unnamed protein product [Didymodactylos carnosus]CAF4466973.1 unnamed protein product [Didymodactylos carnosus]